MFTNEFDFDESVTTVMDENGQLEDIKIYITEDSVFITQWDEREQQNDIITMTTQMFSELQIALNQTEGLFRVIDDED